MELIPVAFTAAAIITPLSMVFGCGAIVDTLPYGSTLLEESLAIMGSTDDQRDIAPKGVLVRHPKNSLHPWRDSAKLFRKCENIFFSFTPRTPIRIRCPIGIGTSHFMAAARRGDYFGGIIWGHRHRLSNRVGGWPHGQTICLCGQFSSVDPCNSLPSLPVDGFVPPTLTPDYHSRMFFTSSS